MWGETAKTTLYGSQNRLLGLGCGSLAGYHFNKSPHHGVAEVFSGVVRDVEQLARLSGHHDEAVQSLR